MLSGPSLSNEKFFPKPRPVIPPTRSLVWPTAMPDRCRRAIRNRVHAIERALVDDGALAVIMDPMDRIASGVCEKRGVTLRAILSHNRSSYVARTRHEIFWHCHTRENRSLCEIGRRFNRDHSTVRSGVRKFQSLLDEGKVSV